MRLPPVWDSDRWDTPTDVGWTTLRYPARLKTNWLQQTSCPSRGHSIMQLTSVMCVWVESLFKYIPCRDDDWNSYFRCSLHYSQGCWSKWHFVICPGTLYIQTAVLSKHCFPLMGKRPKRSDLCGWIETGVNMFLCRDRRMCQCNSEYAAKHL